MSADVTTTTRAGVAIVTLNRPPVNALSSDLYRAFIAELTAVGRDSAVQAVIIRSGLPGIFCAGADIKELRGLSGEDALSMDIRRQSLAREVFETVFELPQPTIAAVNGAALGAGAVIAACCDIRVGSAAASFALPEINIARCGGARHLMRHLPQGTVRSMFFTGRPLAAAEAYRLGLLQELADATDDRAGELAAEIATKSPLALRIGKESLNRSEPLPVAEGYAVEQEHTLRLARSADALEATQAFIEKRAPRFQLVEWP